VLAKEYDILGNDIDAKVPRDRDAKRFNYDHHLDAVTLQFRPYTYISALSLHHEAPKK
jgi:hypothetical protein